MFSFLRRKKLDIPLTATKLRHGLMPDISIKRGRSANHILLFFGERGLI
jgi:hypothetical protein